MTRRILFCEASEPGIGRTYPPAAFAYLAAAVRKTFGDTFFDIRVATQDFATEMDEYAPDLVAITAMTPMWPHAVECAREAAARDIPVVVGGIHITLVPQSLSCDMTVGVMGEGERTFVTLLRLLLEAGEWRPEYLQEVPGICYRDAMGRLQINRRPPLMQSLDRIGMPALEVLPRHREPYVLTSRGCPYRCAFCSSSQYWEQYRAHSPEYTVNLIEQTALHFNARHLWIMDDLFIANHARVKEIARLMRERRLHNRLTLTVAGARANLIDQKVIEDLKSMGVISIGFGFESASPKILKYLKGPQITTADNQRAVDLVRAAGLHLHGYFILGTPGETTEDVRMTYDFIRKNLGANFGMSLLTPYPGTPLWDLAVAKGLVNWQMNFGWLAANSRWDIDQAVLVNSAMTRKELRTWYRRFVALKKAEETRAFVKRVVGSRERAARILMHPARTFREARLRRQPAAPLLPGGDWRQSPGCEVRPSGLS
jgi:radical SAM superfamily enzyme YgiQ (UPF0313 family)